MKKSERSHLPRTIKLERLLENIDIFSPVLQLKIQSHKDFIFSETEFSFFSKLPCLVKLGNYHTMACSKFSICKWLFASLKQLWCSWGRVAAAREGHLQHRSSGEPLMGYWPFSTLGRCVIFDSGFLRCNFQVVMVQSVYKMGCPIKF